MPAWLRHQPPFATRKERSEQLTKPDSRRFLHPSWRICKGCQPDLQQKTREECTNNCGQCGPIPPTPENSAWQVAANMRKCVRLPVGLTEHNELDGWRSSLQMRISRSVTTDTGWEIAALCMTCVEALQLSHLVV